MYPRAQIDTELPGSTATVEVGAAAYLQDWLTWLGCEPGLMFQGLSLHFLIQLHLLHRAVYTLHSTYPCQRYTHLYIFISVYLVSLRLASTVSLTTRVVPFLAQLVTYTGLHRLLACKSAEPIGP